MEDLENSNVALVQSERVPLDGKNRHQEDIRPFSMSDILLANKEIYKLIGTMTGDELLASKGVDLDTKLLQVQNSDLFTKKCLLPLESENT